MLATFARADLPDALENLEDLFKFLPSLTPRISGYLCALAPNHEEQVAAAIGQLVAGSAHTMTEWQALWLVNTIRISGARIDEATGNWLAEQRNRGRGSVLGAEATLALAERQGVAFADIDRASRTDPEALLPWFLEAMRVLGHAGSGSPTQSQLDAVAAESPVSKALVTWDGEIAAE